MPVKIRLMRIGAKKRPFYRVVAVDERNKRTGGYLELLGTYNPLTEPHDLSLKQDRIDTWIKLGAQPSDGFLRITGKAKQRPPRKPKKEKKVETPAETANEKPLTQDETAKSSELETNNEVEQKQEVVEKADESKPELESGNESKEVVDDSAEKTEKADEDMSESSK